MNHPSPRRLLIFGCGYLGQSVAARALEAGWEVSALTRNAAKAAALAASGVAVVQAELQSDSWHDALAGEWTSVVNCVSSGGGGVEGYRHSYLDGMHSINRWLANTGTKVGTFVYTSSTSLYTQSGDVLVDEDAPLVNLSATASILREAEEVVETLPPPTRTFILRLAGIYGPGRHHLLDQLRAGNTIFKGTGRSLLNLIHRDDAAAAIMKAIGKAEGRGQKAEVAVTEECSLQIPSRKSTASSCDESVRTRIYNVADGHPANRVEIAAWLAAQLQLPEPQWLPEVDIATPGVTPPARLFRGGSDGPSRRIAITRIRQEMGWEPQYAGYQAGYGAILRGE
ncbi:MAG: NAD(P)H-binding protein [Verrucomicrobiota bacterium]|nr:NAD(P)H-binding protein [Verrucomicrobiota bacterium]